MADYGEVVTWATAQPWCSGSVGAVGISYEGATALRLPAAGATGVQGVVPQEIEFDVYADVALPGGIFNQAFIQAWSESNRLLDDHRMSVLFPWIARMLAKGVRPADSDRKSRTVLAQARRDHRQNTDVFQAMSRMEYRDDQFGDTGATLDDFSVFHHAAGIQASGVPLFSWGSWLDGTSAGAVLQTFNTFSTPPAGGDRRLEP
jgi:putative CocE/NonD family hydrolase